MYIELHDARVPFPRTSGAKWGHIGFLVVFGRPPNARRQSIKNESYTPRSLSALGGPHGTMVYNGRHSNRSTLSISSFYFQDHLVRCFSFIILMFQLVSNAHMFFLRKILNALELELYLLQEQE